MLKLVNESTARANASLDKALASIDASNKRIETMEREHAKRHNKRAV
jgi:hypothetical protein